MHVLLVEDDADSRMLLSRYIESGGHTVDECSDSPSALAHFANTEYDVVVTDYQLPSMDGSQLASTLLAQVPGLRVLLVTAHPIDGLASSCYRVGVERILNKPIRRAALLGALKTAPELYLGVDSPALRSELEGHCSALGVDYCVIPSRCVGGPLPKGIPQLTDRRIEARGDVVRIGNEGQPHERLLRPPLSPEDLEHLLPERAAADFSSTVANLDPDARDLLPGYISNRKREMGELTAHLERKNLEAIRVLGHRLKGSAGAYGLPELGALGAELEAAALRQDDHRVGSLVFEIRARVDAMEQHLLPLLG